MRSIILVLAVILLVLVGALTGLHLVLPGWVERQMVQRLEAAGVPVRSLEVRRFALGLFDLANVELGPGAELTVDSVRISFRPVGLLQGKLEFLEIGGVEMHATEAFWGMISGLSDDGGGAAGRARPGRAFFPGWPVRRVRVRSARVDFVTPAGRLDVRFSGQAVADGAGGMQWDGVAATSFATSSVHAEADETAEDIRLEFRELKVDLPGAAAWMGYPLGPAPLQGPLYGNVEVARLRSGPQAVRIRGRFEQTLHAGDAVPGESSIQIVTDADGSYSLTDGSAQLQGEVRLSEDRIQVGVAALSWAALQAPWRIGRDAVGTFQAGAQLEIQGGALAVQDALAVWGVDAVLPLRIHDGTVSTGRIEVASVRVGEFELGGASGEVTFDVPRLQVHLRPEVLGSAPIDGTIGPLDDGWFADLRLPPFEMAESVDLQGLLSRQFGVSASGWVGGTARIDPASTDPFWASVQLSNAAFRVEGVSLEGMHGALTLTRLNPPRSDPHQEIRVDRLVTDRVTLTDGLIRFAVEGQDQVFVEENHWSWAGGELSSKPFLYRPSQKAIRLDFVCERIEVAPVLDLILGKQVQGTGQLYGRLPISLRWDPLRFTLDGGYLYAAPGVYALRIQDPDVVGQVVEAATQGIAKPKQREEIKSRVLSSMKDFEYRAFRIDFQTKTTGFPSGSLHIVGEGKGEWGVPLVLDLRFAKKSNE